MAKRRSSYSATKPQKQPASQAGAADQEELTGRPGPLSEAGLEHGMSQVSIVETALSPLDYQPGTTLKHTSEFVYFTSDRKRHAGQVTVTAPEGLSPTDELILYGLLAITFADRSPVLELTATPHFLSRQLGLPIGGAHYKRLRESINRLSTVHYRNSAWWDRRRGQHRDVGFHFLSHDLPAESLAGERSREPWTLVWDPLFFRQMIHSQGFVWFDFETYRALKQPAARRGFLLLQKIFHHRDLSPKFDLRSFAVNQLGYSPTLEMKSIRQKIKKMIENWQALGVVADDIDPDLFFEKNGPGQWNICLPRGPRFENAGNPRPWTRPNNPQDHPAYELLQQIGLTHEEIQNVFRQHQDQMIYVTRAALLSRLPIPTSKRNDPKKHFFDLLKRAGENFLAEEQGPWHAREVYESRLTEAKKAWELEQTDQTRPPEKTKPKRARKTNVAKEINTGRDIQGVFHFPPFQEWLTGDYE